MERKLYSIRVIPEIVKKADPAIEGAFVYSHKYERLSKPDEKAKAKDFKQENFLHLELYEEDDQFLLGGDTKPHTEVLFANASPVLYDKLIALVENEEEYKILNKKSGVIKLNQKLPGLVVNRQTKPYYATYMGKDGRQLPLKANRRNPETGDFEEEKVVMEKLSFFLFANQVTPEDLEIRFQTEKNRIKSWVKGDSDEKVATAVVTAKAVETEGEAPE
jgi:hypothetical protein